MYLKEVSHVKKLPAVAMIGVGWMLSAATAHAQTTPNLFRSASSFRLDPCVIRMFVNCNGVQFRPSEFEINGRIRVVRKGVDQGGLSSFQRLRWRAPIFKIATPARV